MMRHFEFRIWNVESSLAQASWVDDLLGLRELSWGTPDAALGWEHGLPAWAWALIVVGACVFAGWSYSRLLGPRPARMLLAGLRAALILLVAVLLAGPTLIDPDEREEPDALVVLVDRSRSMTIKDMASPDGSTSAATGASAVETAQASPISRDDALRQALLSQAEVFGDQGLSRGVRQTVWLGFGEQVHEMPALTDAEAWDRPGVAADAPATALRSGVEQALRVAAGRPLASVILFSDGRTPQSTAADLVRQVAQRGARVHVVPLGPAEPGLDLVLRQVEAPEQAFTGDIVPISAVVDQVGGAEEPIDPTSVRIRLINVSTGEVIDEQTLEGEAGLSGVSSRSGVSGVSGGSGTVSLTATSDQVGQVRYRIDVVHEPADGQGLRERVTTNNAREVVIEMIDRPVRVLYVEGYPRWDYRYLKNMLLREDSIDSSMLLLSADAAFAQEGDSPITRPPSTAREMQAYDVIILGDVPPGYFTPEQLTLIRDHVATSGAGLLWIGGARDTPGSFAGTVLADLLPMRSPGLVQPLSSAQRVAMEPTPLARALSVLQLRGPGADGAGRGAGEWPSDLPALRWVQDLGPLKPTAEVLARSPQDPDEAPLLVRLRYGAGQSLYLATDETWRWRYGRGELYFEQFWVQLVRMLGRHRVQQTVDRARLTVSHRQVNVGEPVVVELTIDDPALLERELPRVMVAVTRGGGGQDVSPEGVLPTVDEVRLVPVAEMEEGGTVVGDRRVYRAVWRATTPGALVVRVAEPALDDLGLSRELEVVAADDEMRQVAPDHDRLIALAAATGGEVVPLDELDRLLAAVPNLAEKTAVDTRESLWNSWLALILVLGLLTTEWIVRKVIWLV